MVRYSVTFVRNFVINSSNAHTEESLNFNVHSKAHIRICPSHIIYYYRLFIKISVLKCVLACRLAWRVEFQTETILSVESITWFDNFMWFHYLNSWKNASLAFNYTKSLIEIYHLTSLSPFCFIVFYKLSNY